MAIETYITLILGAGIGLLVSELKAYFDNRRGDKRALNTLLYSQLDLWIALKCSNPEFLISTIQKGMDEVFHRFGVSEDVVKKAFEEMSANDKKQLYQILSRPIPDHVVERYEKAVEELAAIDPLLTHKLANKPGTLIFEEMNQKMDMMLDAAPPTDEQKNFVETIKGFYEQLGFKRELSELDSDMKLVARRIGITTKWRLKAHIKEAENRVSGEPFLQQIQQMFLTVGKQLTTMEQPKQETFETKNSNPT